MALFKMKPWYRKRKKELSKYGTADNLTNYGFYSLAATIGDYALVNGKYDKYNYMDVYNKSLIHSTTANLGTYVDPTFIAAATMEDYVLFGGGNLSQGTIVYDKSLTKSSIYPYYSSRRNSVAATSIENYALFAGGEDGLKGVEAYNKSLVVSKAPDLPLGRAYIAAASIKNHALFAGGKYYDTVNRWYDYTDTVDVYDNSLTKSIIQKLSQKIFGMCATAVGDYALFTSCGEAYGYNSVVEIYDKSLTKLSNMSLLNATYLSSATAISNYALIAGGRTNNSYSNIVEVFDNTLTKSITEPLQEGKYNAGATAVGNYVLFAGGAKNQGSNVVPSSSVDVYQVA